MALWNVYMGVSTVSILGHQVDRSTGSWTQSLNSNHDLPSLSDQSELANINGFFHLVWTTKNLVICSRSTLRRIEEKLGTVICRVFPGTNADLALHIWTT